MGRTKGSEAGNLSVTKRGPKCGKDRGVAVIAKSGFDGPLNAPWRKTVSIFKQPVTLVHTTSRETKNPTNEQLRRAEALTSAKNKADKPRQPNLDDKNAAFQLFWAKSLENLCAMVPVCNADRLMMDDNEHIPHSLDLAGKMEPALVMIGCDASAASLCSALHGFGSSTITGQTASKKKLESNPCINTNTEQPFIQAVAVSEQDILQQERRVLDMRKRLQEARKHFHM